GEELLRKEEFQAVYPVIKELLAIDSKDQRVIEICRRLLYSQEDVQDGKTPRALISALSDVASGPKARREAANKLQLMTSPPNSLFNNQLAGFGGGAILIDSAFRYLEDELVAKPIFSSLCDLAMNRECLNQILQNLPPRLKGLDLHSIALIHSLSELLRNVFMQEVLTLRPEEEETLFNLYLTLLADGSVKHGTLKLKQCLIHVLSILTSERRVAQFIRHHAFLEGVLGMCCDETSEIYGLALLFLSKLGEYKGIKNSLERALRAQFIKLQDQTQSYRLLKAIFQTFPDLGLSVISEEGWLLEAIDLIPLETTETQLEFVQILGLACGSSEGRKLVSDAALGLLRSCGKSTDPRIKAYSVLARSKLSIESKAEVLDKRTVQDLVPPLMAIVSDAALDNGIKMTAIESLAYFSLHPPVRTLLGQESSFWEALVKLGAADTAQPMVLYGISAIVSNVAAYRQLLTSEQQQLQRLKKLAKDATSDINSDPNMADELVKRRNALMAAVPGMAAFLTQLAKSKKVNVASNACRALLAFATDRANHGTLLKHGAAKGLLTLAASESKDDAAIATQALAKLTIHTNPTIALPGQLKLEAIRPLLALCSSGSLLQQFESLMALTNLASLDMSLRLRMVELKGLTTIETSLVSDNAMVQRAAAELLCNMTMTQPVFDYYARPSAKHKLHLLCALVDAEDPKTALAAGGALATLSQMPEISLALASLPSAHRIFPLMIAQGASRDLQHRGVEIYKNVLLGQLERKREIGKVLPLFPEEVTARLKALNDETTGSNSPIQVGLQLLLGALRRLP
ncbi:SWI5-dependent HO expression protein 4, partial [Massospora cicadina]